MAADTEVHGLQAIEDWFARQGWQPAPFQRRSWAAFRAGQSGLIHASTGSGKTLAAWLGPVSLALEQDSAPAGLRVLWITPLRALASDTAGNLQQAVDGLGLDWRVETRTGDTSASVRARQRRKLPHALVTTPESLSVLLSYRNVEDSFRHLDAVIVDEWHELLGSKRGVQLQLCLAWLRARRPDLPVWGLSATLGNLEEAMQVLLGKGAFFRRKGLAVPTGQSQDDLQRLSALIAHFEPQRLIVLGDFFHHRPKPGEPFLKQFPDWLARHQHVQVEAVIGNHDRHAKGIDIGIPWHATLDIGPFRLCHEPETVTGRHVLAGHLHPVYSLSAAGDRLRAPVFWCRDDMTVLPSFGALTGGWEIQPQAEDGIVLIVDGELFPMGSTAGR